MKKGYENLYREMAEYVYNIKHIPDNEFEYIPAPFVMSIYRGETKLNDTIPFETRVKLYLKELEDNEKYGNEYTAIKRSSDAYEDYVKKQDELIKELCRDLHTTPDAEHWAESVCDIRNIEQAHETQETFLNYITNVGSGEGSPLQEIFEKLRQFIPTFEAYLYARHCYLLARGTSEQNLVWTRYILERAFTKYALFYAGTQFDITKEKGESKIGSETSGTEPLSCPKRKSSFIHEVTEETTSDAAVTPNEAESPSNNTEQSQNALEIVGKKTNILDESNLMDNTHYSLFYRKEILEDKKYAPIILDRERRLADEFVNEKLKEEFDHLTETGLYDKAEIVETLEELGTALRQENERGMALLAERLNELNGTCEREVAQYGPCQKHCQYDKYQYNRSSEPLCYYNLGHFGWVFRDRALCDEIGEALREDMWVKYKEVSEEQDKRLSEIYAIGGAEAVAQELKRTFSAPIQMADSPYTSDDLFGKNRIIDIEPEYKVVDEKLTNDTNDTRTGRTKVTLRRLRDENDE